VENVPVIPDHELLRPIGGGNYGTVWLGRSILGSYRAIKVVHRRNFAAQRPYDREYAGLMKFEPLSRGHPGLVAVLHVGRNVSQEYFYCIMDLADDVDHGRRIHPAEYQPRTLRTDLDRRHRLPVPECTRIGMALASALGHLHRHGVVHRDVKPSNIIFIDNEPRFADVGLVEDIGETSTFVGSEGYTPPEGPGKPNADLYGLGKVLFEAVTRQQQLLYPELPTGFDSWPDATACRRLLEIIRKACDLNPRRRFQTAGEFYRQLQQILEENPVETGPLTAQPARSAPLRVVLLGDVKSGRLPEFIARLRQAIHPEQALLFVDHPGESSLQWAKQIENEIGRADIVIALLTPASVQSEMLAYELQLAHAEATQRGGRPCILPILLGLSNDAESGLVPLVGTIRVHHWPPDFDPANGIQLIRTLLDGLTQVVQTQPPLKLEAVGGAVPLDSPYYLERPGDRTLREALLQHESVVLIKGARQMGKTSLLARGLQAAREEGFRVVNTDLQQLNAACFESLDNLYFALGNSLADALELETFPEDTWDSRRSSNHNLERYLKREVLSRLTSPLVWGIDELDRLLPCPFGPEVFGLMRSWHNNRALDPSGPWSRLTLAMALATEAHLVMPDLDQSPFNVGVRISLDDFALEQIQQLNRLHGHPLKSHEEAEQFRRLLGGQPYLVRRALHEMAARRLDFTSLVAEAQKEEGIFTDHLRRLVTLLAQDAELVEAIRQLTADTPCTSPRAWHRLRAAGVIRGPSPTHFEFRCELYRLHLRQALGTT